MRRPTRSTVAGRTYLAVQALARRSDTPTDELLTRFVLERFLYRLARSAHRERLVLKGGMLLEVFDVRRPTRDIPTPTGGRLVAGVLGRVADRGELLAGFAEVALAGGLPLGGIAAQPAPPRPRRLGDRRAGHGLQELVDASGLVDDEPNALALQEMGDDQPRPTGPHDPDVRLL
jgi:hypothetical protein